MPLQLIQGGKEGYKQVTCAGGIILIGRGQVVLVRPLNGNNEWLLPKGHQEDGETLEQCAIREAKEETGAVCSVEEPGVIYVTSHRNDVRKEEKTITWYLLRAAALKTELSEIIPDRASTKRDIGIFPTVVALSRLTYEDQRDVIATVLGGKVE